VSDAPRVLIVDDDAGTCETLGDVLVAKGYVVRTAPDGRAGLEAVRRERVDVAILDLRLPDLDGLDLLQSIKRACPGIEVIIVTAHASLSTAIQAMDGAAFSYFTKPVDMDQLLATVEKAREKQELVRALRDSEERYRFVTEHTLDAIFLVDLEGRYTFGNTRLEELTGYRLEELIGQSVFMVLTPEGAQTMSARRDAVRAGGNLGFFYETEIVRKDGTRIWAEISSTSVMENGQLIARLGVARDITERKRNEIALRESEERFRTIFEQAGVGIAVVAADGRWLRVNQRLCEMVGYSAEELQVLRYQDLTHPDDLDTSLRRRRTMLEGEARAYSFEKRYIHKNGSIVWINLTTSVMRSAPADPSVSISVIEDISQGKAAEAALRESEERFRATFEQAAVGITIVAGDGRFLSVNQRLSDMVGYSPRELANLRFQDITHPDDLELNLALRRPMVANDAPAYAMEKRYIHKDGSIVWVHVTASQARDVAGQTGYSIGIIQDITARKQLEEELRHAQRMEGVGQLAGGIAHDFNNLLTVIRARSELAAARLQDADPLRRDLQLIQKTADRAAALTRQLLAFSRKQVLQPKVVALDELITGATDLLKRLIGEHIDLTFEPGADVGRVRVDPGQLEQVIVNLAVNARDVMPEGGLLTLETANVELDAAYAARHVDVVAGSYVMLAVSDTGMGMSHEIQARIFEPFFTTKGPGKGTGLGLSTVYGIVKQSGGHIRVDSEPGAGTTFKVYLPRTDAVPEASAARTSDALPHGTETVLLVEDEAEVRGVTKEVLEGFGYTVLEAAQASDAMLIARRHVGMIDLLLTDVVMPRMSGRALAEAVAAERPETKILFMSGYTDDAIILHRVMEPGMHFLEKPFSPAAVARKVREVLDAP
jgi:two-component system cell cycle sensor histidine kinase/response regulator CckA